MKTFKKDGIVYCSVCGKRLEQCIHEFNLKKWFKTHNICDKCHNLVRIPHILCRKCEREMYV